MTTTLQPKLALYAVLAALGSMIGLLTGRAELVLFGAPFLLALLVDLTIRRASVRASLAPPPAQALEGEEIDLLLEVETDTSCRVDVALPLPSTLELVSATNPFTLSLTGGERRIIALRARCVRWGIAELTTVAFRVRSPFDIVHSQQGIPIEGTVRISPNEPSLRKLVRPLATQLFSGNQVARARGDGTDFADVRPYQAGDRTRAINWRASARNGTLMSNDRHPERNADLAILIDACGDVGRGAGTTYDDTVRAACALARRALAEGDRVGLLNLGGTSRWLPMRAGSRQLYRIVDTLLGSGPGRGSQRVELGELPRRMLSPGALVLALTPLLDERVVEILLSLRSRGYDVTVIEVTADPQLGPRARTDERSALRLWHIVRESLRARFLLAGVPVVQWPADAPLEAALREVSTFRRRTQRTRLSA